MLVLKRENWSHFTLLRKYKMMFLLQKSNLAILKKYEHNST